LTEKDGRAERRTAKATAKDNDKNKCRHCETALAVVAVYKKNKDVFLFVVEKIR
jgi:hypothetical protein